MTPKLSEEQVLDLLHGQGLAPNEGPSFLAALDRFVAVLGGLRHWSSAAALERIADHFDDEQRAWLRRLAEAVDRRDEAAMVAAVGADLYEAQKERRFGESNPQRMDLAFWELMVRQCWSAWHARMLFEPACREYMARLNELPDLSPAELAALSDEERAAVEAQEAAVPRYKEGSAVWCFQRLGQTRTPLPDGREVWIGGEHEDWYDADFCIYNDVVVIDQDLKIDIYGYPRQLFRPTDFHSATLVGAHIYIVGCLGYFGTQPIGATPVLRLDVDSFALEKVETSGDNPGWIYGHTAAYVPERHAIRVVGGKVLLRFTGKRSSRRNRRVYWLDLATGRWSTGSRQAGG